MPPGGSPNRRVARSFALLPRSRTGAWHGYARGMPAVTRISVAPVKGLGLVHPESVSLDRHGVSENRRFHIVDAGGRRFNQLRNGALVRIRPEYDAGRERLVLHFPDGSVADGEVALGTEVTTDFYDRPVVGNYVEGPWSAALSEWAGLALRLVQSPASRSTGAAVTSP